MSGIQIAKVRGIAVTVHWSLWLILPLLVFGFVRVFREAAVLAKVPPEEVASHLWAWGLGLAVALFVSVLLHELAHSLYALARGVEVREITLLAIGGVSQLTETPRTPRTEAVMAFVGPLTSLAIGAGLLVANHFLYPQQFVLRFALTYLGVLNLFLAAFNLLPAFPMDGGRIVRALLTRRRGRVEATRVASTLGKGFAILFGIVGAFGWNLILVFIAVFLFIGADAELKRVLIDEALRGLKVEDVMSRAVATVSAGSSVRQAAERMLADRLSALEVIQGETPVGVISSDTIRAIPREQWEEVSVSAAFVPAPTLAPEENAVRAAELFGSNPVPLLAVMQEGRLVGTVGRDDLERWIHLRAAASQHREEQRRWRGPELPA